jgi:hypothetical protein
MPMGFGNTPSFHRGPGSPNLLRLQHRLPWRHVIPLRCVFPRKRAAFHLKCAASGVNRSVRRSAVPGWL